MKFTDVTIDGKEFKITTWGMAKQLENQHVVMPLLKEPLVNAMAFATESDASETMFVAAIMDGVMEALASVDMLKLSTVLLDGVAVRTAKGNLVPTSIEVLEQEGCDISTVLVLCINVIKENYGALLKKGLADSLLGLTNGFSPQESPSSSEE